MAFQERSTPSRAGRHGNFVGSGWSFPVRVGSHGGLALITGTNEIDNSLRMILETAPGERVMRPDFGCAMWDQVFESPDAGTRGLIAQAVREAIGRWEPRIELTEVSAQVVDDGGSGQRIDIAIGYVVRATNDRRNLVHPFYTIPSEGGSVEPSSAPLSAADRASQSAHLLGSPGNGAQPTDDGNRMKSRSQSSTP